MAQWEFISPTRYVVNASANWFLGRKTSGCPMLQYKTALGAQVNTIIQIPLPYVTDEAHRQGKYIKAVHLHHLPSSTSAGVTPLVSCATKVWEAVHVAGGLSSVPVTVQLPNAGTSAGFVNDASGTAWTGGITSAGVMVSALSGVTHLDTVTNIVAATRFSGLTEGSGQPYAYIPRLARTIPVIEISASMGASATWEHYGAWVEYQ